MPLGATCTGTGTPEVVSFPSRTVQYLRLVLTQAVSPNRWAIEQLDMY